ncbi:MAG: alpha-L-fucosidase, partial [Bacteroidetes bacterium]|nr:alpha-L-fucosidase [Bacteroidota bacterium]
SDRNYKSTRRLIQYLVNAAGRDANFLLNIGPMPDGGIQSEFTDTLAAMGKWLGRYGRSIYGTRGNIIPPQEWGVLTAKEKSVFVHIMKPSAAGYILLPGLKKKVNGAVQMNGTKALRFKQQPEGVLIYTYGIEWNETDTIVELKTES